MGITKERDERDGYIYDAAIKGADTTVWQDVVGAIALDTTGLNSTVRVSAARLHTYLLHIYGDYEFSLSSPSNPGIATDMSWGLRNPKDLTRGAAYFEMDTNSLFRAISYDDFGNQQATTVTWDTNWSDTQVRYKIRWEQDIVNFLINDTVVATHSTRVGTFPQSLEIRNGAATNLDMAYVRVARAGAIV